MLYVGLERAKGSIWEETDLVVTTTMDLVVHFCRGLKTVLVEKEDFAAGTSSRSTKLVHGGVRYLEKAFKNFDYGQLKLVFEALSERKTVLDSAPHLAHPLPIMTVRA